MPTTSTLYIGTLKDVAPALGLENSVISIQNP